VASADARTDASATATAGATATATATADANATLTVEVTDDGCGGANPTDGSGLRGLKDRVETLGGRFALDSPPGGGTRLSATFHL
jgi:signal transduction histidine kinase